ncbi:RNA polymerase sigma-70 factor [Paenibacillus doosanensis]|uniref:RNA polymerase sigma-70 factor n=1 Tax=Paenibacillus doosanensis TaxID=1229154 RepID=UPI00217FC606|nr:RNA polymerase sigma-70 factor [Paenibacillus doosanensis]
MDLDALYTEHKRLLISVAYRMLGSLTDAEDVVQDAFVALQQTQTEDVRHLKAYLVKMVTNRCLNLLKSARRQREVYVGPWLPEPQADLTGGDSPEEQLVRDENVSYALLVMLQQLTPAERAVFLLREVLDYDYAQMADILGKSEANCRKILSRAKQKMNPEAVSAAPKGNENGEFAKAFLAGSRTGNFRPFVHMLIEQATLISDGGGKVRAAIFPIYGKERIQAFLEGIYSKGSLSGELRQAIINGDHGLVLIEQNKPRIAVCFKAFHGKTKDIEHVYLISNPDKLAHIRLN